MRRAFFLYRLWLRSVLRRLRHDLGRELTVLVASLVLFATFFYIFNDFLNVQIAALSLPMRERFAAVTSSAVLALAVVCSVIWVQRARASQRGLATAAAYLGETRRVLLVFEAAQAATILFVAHAGAWILIERWLSHWRGAWAQGLGAGLVVLSSLLIGVRWRAARGVSRERPLRRGGATTARDLPAAGHGAAAALHNSPAAGHGAAAALPDSPAADHDHRAAPVAGHLPSAASPGIVRALAAWRLRALAGRSRICSLCLLLALATQIFIILAAWRQTPSFVAAAAGLASGYLGALALCALLADDLRQIWLERGAGVSHHEFIQSYKLLGWLLAVGLGLTAAIFYTATTLATGSFTVASLQDAAKIAATTAVPALVTPYLMFQIDAHRLAITALTVLIAALFIGTAVLANWLGLALIPLLAAFAGQAQAGRFYRA